MATDAGTPLGLEDIELQTARGGAVIGPVGHRFLKLREKSNMGKPLIFFLIPLG